LRGPTSKGREERGAGFLEETGKDKGGRGEGGRERRRREREGKVYPPHPRKNSGYGLGCG